MSTDVSKAIQELLFEQIAVIVPGLGGFTSTPGSATVDYVQDVITPPASKLDFNPNLVINDGLLVHYLQKVNTSTYQEAEQLIEKYVAEVRGTLERREIFEIPKVGRLYQDYEHKIRFMPESTNFNADSFGLPIIEFQPLVKEKSKVAPTPVKQMAEATPLNVPISEATATAAAITVEDDQASMLVKALPWMVLLAAILIALSLYSIFSKSKGPVADIAEVPERVNVKPSLPADTATLNAPTESKTPPTTEQSTPATPSTTTPPKEAVVPDAADTESDDFEPTKEKAFLVVHSFGKKSNATNFAETLTDDGYATQTKKVGNLYRVGVTFAYSSNSDIEKMRRELAAKYKAGPKTEKELEEMGQ